jgi:hypothetical protein
VEEREFHEDLGLDMRIILKWTFRKENWPLDWINLAQDQERWRDILYVTMSPWFS